MAKILIVDDSVTVRKILVHTLKPKNFKCVEAVDGIDALEKLAKAFGTEIPELLADPEPAHLGERLIAQVRRAISNRHRIREEAALYA